MTGERWVRHDGAVRWLEHLGGPPAILPPRTGRLERWLDWLDGFMPMWEEQLMLALFLIALALGYRVGR